MLAKLFEEQVKKQPHKIAIRAGDGFITYEELNRQANRIARHLEGSRAGSFPGTGGIGHVGLLFDHGPGMIAAILGVLKASRVYVPLSPAYPWKRIAYMLKDSEASILLTQPGHEEFARALARETGIEVMVPGSETGPAEDNPHRPIKKKELAYIMYTSGSTGKPKGVMQTHENVLYYTRNWTDRFSITGMDRMTLFSSFCHDGSVQDMFSALLNGAVLYPFDMKGREESMELSQFLTRERITIWHSVPSLYSFFAGTLTGEEQFKDLRYILLGGEPVREHEIILLREHFSYSTLVNVYGQTESSVNSTWQVIPQDKYERLLIGEPLDKTRLYVIDEAGNPVEPLEIGEILVVCDHVSPGYWKNQEATEAAFGEEAGFGKLYWTGDLGCLHPDGGIEFLGRKDFQVKIRGFRVEPGEIETQLLKHPHINAAVVTAGEDEAGDKYLCAYFVAGNREPGEGEPVSIETLRKFLAGELPDYMIPTYFVPLETFPLTQSGKIDRKALPAPQIEKAEKYTGPRDFIEERLVETWAEVLKIEKDAIGIDSNFFALGGHSLKATTLVSRLHKKLNVKVLLAQVFKTPTVRGLAAYIKKAVKERYTAVQPVEKKEYYVLSSAQKRLYILQQMQPGETGYNMPRIIPFTSGLTVGALKEKLEQVFKTLIARHESLRTSFHLVGGQPVQKVHDEVEFEIEYLTTDYTDYTDKNYKLQITNYKQIPNYNDQNYKQKGSPSGILFTPSAKKSLVNCQGRGEVPSSIKVEKIIRDFIRPFDLSEAPLLRVRLLEAAEQQYRLFIDMHHIITDGTSQVILNREFQSLFQGKDLLPLKLQYKDYAERQNHKEQQALLTHQQAYWLGKYSASGPIPVLNLPLDYPRPLIQSFDGQAVKFLLTEPESQTLEKLAKEINGTVFMVLLSVFNVLLAKLSGQEEIIVGTPIAARRHNHLETIIGMFVNTLALRNYPCGSETFNEFLLEVKQDTLEALENQEYPFEDLVERLSLPRDTGRNPLFDVMINVLNQDGYHETLHMPSMEKENQGPPSYIHMKGTAKFDLTLTAVAVQDSYLLVVEYGAKLFAASTIDRMIEYTRKILELLAGGSGQRIADMEIIPGPEKHRLLYEWNETPSEYPRNKTLHELFVGQVERTPDRVALVGEKLHNTKYKIQTNSKSQITKNKPQIQMAEHEAVRDYISITYSELKQQSGRLAHMLNEKGVQVDTIVGIMAERSVETIVGIFGILKAGGAYMPVDPEYPEERIDYMLKDSKPVVLLTAPTVEEAINRSYKSHMSYISPGDPLASQPPNFLTSQLPNFHLLPATSLAYVIYTSGSMGIPKGVMIQHRSAVNVVHWFASTHHLQPGTHVLQMSDYTFDPSVNQIFGTLHRGAVLYIINKDWLLDIKLLRSYIQRHQTQVVNFVPSVLKDLLGSGEKLESIQAVISGGERLDDAVKAQIMARGYVVYNQYGPTETTIDALAGKCSTGRVTLGKPIANVKCYIFDRYDRLTLLGVAGELCISGAGVARGYLNRPELTAEKFLSVPSVSSVAKKIYRSGDLARWQPEGNIEYLGRIDHQVKIRGYRIELGEIENRLSAHPLVKETVVIARNDTGGDKYLCAYIVAGTWEPGEGEETLVNRLREFLAKELPQYMIPSYFELLDQVPLTSSGKVDRGALPEPGIKGRDSYTPPTGKIEKKLVEIWAGVLGRDPLQTSQLLTTIGIDDNFFERGGHSLKATLLAAEIKKEFNLSLPLIEIFNRPNIRHQAEYIGAQTQEPTTPREDNPLVLLKAGKSSENHLFFIHDGSGEVEGYMEFCKALGNDCHCWGIRAEAEYDYAPRNMRIEEMAGKYIQRILRVQATGPYSILGWSFGGTLAFEIVRQLEQQQEEIEILALVDVWPPPETPVETGQTPFTPESESNLVKEWLPPDLYEKIREIPRVEHIWKLIVEYLEQDNPGEVLESIKGALDRYGGHRMLDYQRLRTRELIRYLNIFRSFHRARGIYIPTGKINIPIHYFKASESRITRPEKWRQYTHQPIILFEVKGDHYSIFKRPAVLDFAKKFDLILDKNKKNSHQDTKTPRHEESTGHWPVEVKVEDARGADLESAPPQISCDK